MRVGPVVRGALTYLPGSGLWGEKHTGRHHDAEYFYEIWIKHLTLAMHHGMPRIPRVVAELGPGDSIGAGLAALLSGADVCYALDATRYTHLEDSLGLFDELVDMFRRRAPRPARGWPDYDSLLDDTLFPGHILTPAVLERTLAPARVARIRSAILSGGDADGMVIRYVAPWDDVSQVAESSVDFVFSHAVLQHVVDVDNTQECVAQWLKPDGWFSHQVDLGCMGLSAKWNGHRACPEPLWQLLMGKRAWLINRLPISAHVQQIDSHGMRIVKLMKAYGSDGIKRSELAARWQDLSDDDLNCRSAFLQGVRVGCGTQSAG